MNRKVNLLATLVLANLLATLAWISLEELRYRTKPDQLDRDPTAPAAANCFGVGITIQVPIQPEKAFNLPGLLQPPLSI